MVSPVVCLLSLQICPPSATCTFPSVPHSLTNLFLVPNTLILSHLIWYWSPFLQPTSDLRNNKLAICQTTPFGLADNWYVTRSPVVLLICVFRSACPWMAGRVMGTNWLALTGALLPFYFGLSPLSSLILTLFFDLQSFERTSQQHLCEQLLLWLQSRLGCRFWLLHRHPCLRHLLRQCPH